MKADTGGEYVYYQKIQPLFRFLFYYRFYRNTNGVHFSPGHVFSSPNSINFTPVLSHPNILTLAAYSII
jgi:hypothetical protein